MITRKDFEAAIKEAKEFEREYLAAKELLTRLKYDVNVYSNSPERKAANQIVCDLKRSMILAWEEVDHIGNLCLRQELNGSNSNIILGDMVNDKNDHNHGKRLLRYFWTHYNSGKSGSGSCYVWDITDAHDILERWNKCTTKGNWYYESSNPIGCDSSQLCTS